MENKPAKRQTEMLPMIFAENSRREIIRHYSKLTPERVLGGDYPSLAKLRKEHTEEKIEAALGILIIDTTRAFGEAWPQEAALDLATEILTDYYYLSLEDCMVVLNRLKRTKVFKFTINVVLNAFENYDKERLKMIDDTAYSEHLSIKETPTYSYKKASTLAEKKRIPKEKK